MEITELEVLGTEWALRAMRKPYLSKGNKKKDIELAQKLTCLGREHRKFLRQLTIQIEMSASMAFWFEFDTYKVGTTSNSESFFFVKGKRPLHLSDFVIPVPILMSPMQAIIDVINEHRYLRPAQLRYIVPQGVKYSRIVTLTGEAYFNMYHQRKQHQLEEWREFTKQTKELIKDEIIHEILFKNENSA